MDDDKDARTDRGLDDCREIIVELRAENEELRESAETFGELAERLNRALHPGRSQEALLPRQKDHEPDV